MSSNKLDEVFIIDCSHEAINTAIFLANLGKQVYMLACADKIEETLLHYKFDTQMSLAWSLYVAKQKIMPVTYGDDEVERLKNDVAGKTIWLFLDNLSDDDLACFAQKQANPHTHIILSGVKKLSKIHELSCKLKTQWVYYLPFVFIKEGMNFNAFYQPDLVMIGEKTPDSVMYSDVLLFLKNQAKICEISDIKTIEFARSSIMAMLGTRLSLMNELARLADSESVNIKAIERIMGQDSRVGASYLSAGWGFGGKSLPNELALLKEKFEQNQVENHLLSSVLTINEDQKELSFRKFWQYFDGNIENRTVAIWGAGYRIGAGVTTNSAIHPLLKLLWSYHIKTYVYLNNTNFELEQLYNDNPLLSIADQPYEILQNADALFIVNWSGLIPPDVNELNKVALPIFDAKNILTDSQVASFKGEYFGIGR
ncbi:UDP-glucose dehydrogenase [Moraxella macacae 0408225]|uniref:UDP-glucose 6-dehydrogenase n=1 Tax=Moraxella macacae 0408225 TaxID=1230338 RepID=L2FA00_9GAMM|nr:UDP-glucose dehydrogenase [Moraxella macacae]ELA09298.1 UDP-glucose dehydrogenase [Moraxella macacae 0408225]